MAVIVSHIKPNKVCFKPTFRLYNLHERQQQNEQQHGTKGQVQQKELESSKGV